MKKLLLFFSMPLLAFSLAACDGEEGDDGDNGGNDVVKLVKKFTDGEDALEFTYDDQNRVVSVNSPDFYFAVEYGDNSITFIQDGRLAIYTLDMTCT